MFKDKNATVNELLAVTYFRLFGLNMAVVSELQIYSIMGENDSISADIVSKAFIITEHIRFVLTSIRCLQVPNM